jgi:hypothetical protein
MPVYTVELTYIQRVSVEARNADEARMMVLEDEELPFPSHESANVTGVEITEED